ncbi:MAG: hypothetical protein ACKPBB_23730 [Sphaerospermopsis kisseleviana]
MYKWNRHLACSTKVQNIRIIQFSCVTAYLILPSPQSPVPY